MPWILVIALATTHGVAVSSIELKDKNSCYSAKSIIRPVFSNYVEVMTYCVPKDASELNP